MAGSLFSTGELGASLNVLQEAIETAQKNGNLLWVTLLETGVACVYEEAHAFQDSIALTERGLALARKSPVKLPLLEQICLVLLGLAQAGLGKYEEAWASFRDVERQPNLHLNVRMTLYLGLSRYWLQRGDSERARAAAQKEYDLVHEAGERTHMALAKHAMAAASMAEQRWEDAESDIQDAIQLVHGGQYLIAEWRVHSLAADLHEKRGRAEEARDALARSAAAIGRLAHSLDGFRDLQQQFVTSSEVRAVLGWKSEHDPIPGEPKETVSRIGTSQHLR